MLLLYLLYKFAILYIMNYSSLYITRLQEDEFYNNNKCCTCVANTLDRADWGWGSRLSGSRSPASLARSACSPSPSLPYAARLSLESSK